MRLDIYIHFATPLKVESPDMPAVLAEIKCGHKTIMDILDELKAQVARDTEVTQSAVTLLRGLKEKLDAAGTDPVKLKELSASLGKNTDDLAAAVVESTPSEP